MLSVTGTVARANAGDRADFDMAMLEALPQHSFVTATPWFKTPRRFSGPLLRDVMAAAGVKGTTLSGKVQYLDAKYNELHLFTAAPRDNFGCPFTFTGGTAGGAPVKDFNCSGNPLLFSPKWTVNLGAEQVVPLGSKLELVANVNTAWRDDQWGAFEYLDFERIPAYWTTDAALTVPWSVSTS